MFGRLTSDRQRSDVDSADGSSARTCLNDGNPRDYRRHANCNVELVWARRNGLKDILRAYMSVRCRGSDEKTKQENEKQANKTHRCTLRIHRPKLKPIQVLMEP